MGLLEQARLDMHQITGNSSEFGISMTFTAPDSSSCTVIGFHTKHHMAYNDIGEQVNHKKSSVAISEVQFTSNSYPCRNSSGEIYLESHLVSVVDSTGIEKQYVCEQWFPDEALGLVVIILGDYDGGN